MSKTKRYSPKKNLLPNSSKGKLLYIFLIPLFLSVTIALFQTSIKAFLLNIVSFSLFLVVVYVAKKGFLQEEMYNQNTFSKAPSIPYKTLGGYLLGGATFFTAFIAGEQTLIKSAFLALISIVGYYLYYGFDPKKDKFENLGDISAEFVLETINEAKTKLALVENDMREIKDMLLHEKLNIAVDKAKKILQTIQEDPKDVRVSRKFLIVYIDGIAKVTNAYTDLEESSIDTKTKKKLHKLMDDVEQRFDKEIIRLKGNNHFDLDVHIDVLKEQIKH